MLHALLVTLITDVKGTLIHVKGTLTRAKHPITPLHTMMHSLYLGALIRNTENAGMTQYGLKPPAPPERGVLTSTFNLFPAT
jgi:hypothetical protein